MEVHGPYKLGELHMAVLVVDSRCNEVAGRSVVFQFWAVRFTVYGMSVYLYEWTSTRRGAVSGYPGVCINFGHANIIIEIFSYMR